MRVLLRDPMRFVWKYALGWRRPDEAEEPVTLDPLAFGNLVLEVLREAVEGLERDRGFAGARLPRLEAAIDAAIIAVAQRWETGSPVPPRIT